MKKSQGEGHKNSKIKMQKSKLQVKNKKISNEDGI
jgi:hypothetical protein